VWLKLGVLGVPMLLYSIFKSSPTSSRVSIVTDWKWRKNGDDYEWLGGRCLRGWKWMGD